MNRLVYLGSLLLIVFMLFGCEGLQPGDGTGTDTAGTDTTNTDTNATDSTPSDTTPVDSGVDVSSHITAARIALENQDISGSNMHFQEAYDLNPANKDANFGLAITDIIMLIEDPEVMDIVQKWGETLPTANEIFSGGDSTDTTSTDSGGLFDGLLGDSTDTTDTTVGTMKAMISDASKSKAITELKTVFNKLPKPKASLAKKAKAVLNKTIPDTAPSISEMQAVADNTILPAVQGAINKLRFIEGTNFIFIITPDMTGGGSTEDILLDDAEYYIIDAALSAVKSVLNIATAYNLDVDYNIIEADPLSAINGPYNNWASSTVDSADFLTLKSDGLARYTTALTSLQEAVDQIENAYLYAINDDSDVSYDNGIDLSGLTQEDKDIAQKAIDAVQMALSGLVTAGISVDNTAMTTTFSISDGTATITHVVDGTDAPDESINVDLTKLFTSPLDRTDLPVIVYDLPLDTTLSQLYSEPVAGIIGYETIDAIPMPATNLPDLTFNGVFPDGVIHPDTFEKLDGMLLFDSAVMLSEIVPQADGILASDGTLLYTFSNTWDGYSGTKSIVSINPTTGDIVSSYDITESDIWWISDLAFSGTDLWAIGDISDGYYGSLPALFKIDLATGTVAETRPLNVTADWAELDALASDGSNFYVGVSYGVCDYYGSDCNEEENIVKVHADDTEITLNDVIVQNSSPESLAYDSGYIWADGIKRSALDGSPVNSYIDASIEGISVVLNGNLYSLNQDRIHVMVEP